MWNPGSKTGFHKDIPVLSFGLRRARQNRTIVQLGSFTSVYVILKVERSYFSVLHLFITCCLHFRGKISIYLSISQIFKFFCNWTPLPLETKVTYNECLSSSMFLTLMCCTLINTEQWMLNSERWTVNAEQWTLNTLNTEHTEHWTPNTERWRMKVEDWTWKTER